MPYKSNKAKLTKQAKRKIAAHGNRGTTLRKKRSRVKAATPSLRRAKGSAKNKKGY